MDITTTQQPPDTVRKAAAEPTHTTATRNQDGAQGAYCASDIARDILTNCLEVDNSTISATAHLADDLGLDSLALLDFSLVAADQYGIVLSDDALRQIATFADLVACMERELAATRD
ncbi:acyl carrier protein [Burkholderia ambifaria]|uniref:acyl carrier protein n=1 Tax=Burkholderia ambifaria TaxID=152480 RepID=UPI001590A220|nr:acyl carrier protein [Burkholderia ambifaria]